MARHEFRLQKCRDEGWPCVAYPAWWDATLSATEPGIAHDRTREAVQFLYDRERPGYVCTDLDGIYISDPNVAFEFRMRFT